MSAVVYFNFDIDDIHNFQRIENVLTAYYTVLGLTLPVVLSHFKTLLTNSNWAFKHSFSIEN